MSTTIVTYSGKLQATGLHQESNSQVAISVPVELGGLNTAASPTDYVAHGLGGCLLVTMGMIAERRGWNISGTTATVIKTMTTTKPLRIAKLETTIRVTNANRFDADQRKTIERAAQHCAVHHSLHPDIEAPISFVWEE
jgi:putative redox protein